MTDPQAPGVRVVAVRTPTLPPATHTNAVVLGRDHLVVVDPASPWEEEQRALLSALDAMGSVRQIVLTHHHHDHVSGARSLQRALAARGRRVPIVAHPVNRRWLEDVSLDDVIEDEAFLETDDGRRWEVLFTPGHAPGHVALWNARDGVAVAGDLVAGVGTILIDPHDGDLADYLASLERLAEREPQALVPSHGPVLAQGQEVLRAYLTHRHRRSEQILEALSTERSRSPEALVPAVYVDLDPFVVPLAALQIESHLRWLAREGLAEVGEPGGWRRRR